MFTKITYRERYLSTRCKLIPLVSIKLNFLGSFVFEKTTDVRLNIKKIINNNNIYTCNNRTVLALPLKSMQLQITTSLRKVLKI